MIVCLVSTIGLGSAFLGILTIYRNQTWTKWTSIYFVVSVLGLIVLYGWYR